MTRSDQRTNSAHRIVWVGIIAAVAAVLSRLWTESLLVIIVVAAASAAISMAIVWLVDR